MKDELNIWGIEEYKGDSISCPVIPKNLPWYKKIVLTFFRFGVCPLCVTMSLGYGIKKWFTDRRYYKQLKISEP